MHLRYRQTCRVCGNSHLVPVLDLGEQYLQGAFVHPDKPKPSLRKIPTALVRCDTQRELPGGGQPCGAVQMSVSVPPSILYANYFYASSTTETMRRHLAQIVERIMEVIHNGRAYKDLRVADLACNDGSLLSHYPYGVTRYGVDPSDIARSASKLAKDATIINDLFPTAQLPGDFDAISTIAMFYDIEEPVAFVQQVAQRLKPNGIWVMEVAYLPATLAQVSLDTAVHEHLLYYSLATIEHVVKAAGMRVFRAETNSINGGSIQVYCCKADCAAHDKPEWTRALSELRTREFDLKLDTDEPYQLFRSQCEIARHELAKLIRDIRARGQKVFLYGASTKANTMVQYAGLSKADLPYALERSEAKWGARTLGTDIEIISEAEGRAMEPDFVVVGPWHFRDEILRRERDTINGTGGRKPVGFIFALPKLEVVTSVA